MSDLALALTIAGMAAVTFGPRLVPTLFLAAPPCPGPSWSGCGRCRPR